MNKKIFFQSIAIFCLFFISTLTTVAQGYILLAPIPTTSASPSFTEFLKALFTLGVGLAIVFAVIMIILGALGYVLAAVPSAKADGKKKITDAIIGLLILFISTIILNTINPDLLRTGLNLAHVPATINGTSTGGNNGGGGGGATTQYCCYGSLTGQQLGGSYSNISDCGASCNGLAQSCSICK